MKKTVLPICITILAALLLCTGATAATPSFFGYTGLIVIPTADALSKGEFSAGAFATDVKSGPNSHVYSVNLGLANSTEIGFAKIKTEDSASETSVDGKYAFQKETRKKPAIAAGIIDITGEVKTTAYVVMSKALQGQTSTKFGEITTPRIYAGIGGGQLDGFFGGVSASLGERLLLMAEYDSADVNVGARLAITKEIKIHGALLDGNDLALGASFTKIF